MARDVVTGMAKPFRLAVLHTRMDMLNNYYKIHIAPLNMPLGVTSGCVLT